MKYDTAGNPIFERIANCSCGLTGGCEMCNGFIEQYATPPPGTYRIIDGQLCRIVQDSLPKTTPLSWLDDIPITDEEIEYYENLPPYSPPLTP